MEDLPDLDRLSVAEKDRLIRELWLLRKLVGELTGQIGTLTAKVEELEGWLALNSFDALALAFKGSPLVLASLDRLLGRLGAM